MTTVKILPEILSNQIAAGEVVQRPSSVIKELVENSIDAGSKNITIEIEANLDKLILPIDEDKYEKIISNLLSNSLKHLNAKGQIKIRIEMLELSELQTYFGNNSNRIDDSFVKISVIDNGVGIPQKDLPYIFDRFTQSKIDSKKPDYSGTGIGLNFTKKLVELHHGSITVSSKKNEETVFSFILPLNEKIYKKIPGLKGMKK